jgi:hypothetical protein
VTVLALVLVAVAAAAPLLAVPLRRRYIDPTILVAGATALLLAAAAVVAAFSGDHDGWRRASALVLGVVVATTGGSDVVRATFRLIRGERHVRRRPRPGRANTDTDTDTDVAPGASVEELSDAPTQRLTAPATDQPVATDEPGGPALETVLRGGAWIGYLERAAISATLLAGWPEGMALALAVKGVGRYPELKEPSPNVTNAPEAFIIGTLASVLWAAAAAGAATLLT